MASLFILIPIAIIFIALAIKIFFWAIDDGQFEDLEGAAYRILFDNLDDEVKTQNTADINNEISTGKIKNSAIMPSNKKDS